MRRVAKAFFVAACVQALGCVEGVTERPLPVPPASAAPAAARNEPAAIARAAVCGGNPPESARAKVASTKLLDSARALHLGDSRRRELLEEAVVCWSSNKDAAALLSDALVRRALTLDPADAERRTLLLRALELDPANETAAAGLPASADSGARGHASGPQ